MIFVFIQNLRNYPGKMIIFMALKSTIFGFFGTKSLRKNYNLGKKCIINIGFKVFSKNGKMAKNSILPFLNFMPFFHFLKKNNKTDAFNTIFIFF